jgi:hypothetical protein
LDLSDIKEYGLPASGIAISSLASIYLYVTSNPIFALTLVGTVLQVVNSLPKNADIILATNEARVGNLLAQVTGAYVDLDFFNRGREIGQLLKISHIRVEQNDYWDTTTRIERASFPIRIEPRQHEFLKIGMQFHRKVLNAPPSKYQINVQIEFEVSSRKGSRGIGAEFKVLVGDQ